MRYYVAQSSWFVSHPYNARLIASAVRSSGGSNVRTANQFGWSNQPKVVTFTASSSQLKTIRSAVERAVGTQWIIIRKKDW